MNEEKELFPSENNPPPAAYSRLLEIWSEREKAPKASPAERLVNLCLRVGASLFRSIFTTILSILTLTTALFLFSLFIFTIETVEHFLITAQSKVTLTVYLKDDAGRSQVEDLWFRLKRLDPVKSVKVLSKEEALRAFRARLGKDGGVLEGLEARNPLPASLEVDFKEGRIASERISSLREDIERNGIVDQVHYNQTLLDRLSGVLAGFRFAALGGGSFMLLITAFIIWNTIKLALYSRREELTVLKLLGATDYAISLPYILEGFIEGLCAGVLAVVLLSACAAFAPELIRNAEELREILPALPDVSIKIALMIVLAGSCISLLSSFFAARSFLREHHEL